MGRVLDCERGSATVEAVVMLPFFVVLVVGALHLHRLGSAHQQAQMQARACAQAHALAGCPDSPPALCTADVGGREASKGGHEELTAVDDYDDFTSNLGFLQPFVEGFLGESFSTKREAEVLAFMSSDDEVKVSAQQVWLCNPTPPSFMGFLRDIFGAKERLAESE